MVTLKKIGLESKGIVQEILDDCPTYMLNCEGVNRREDGAVYELTLLPPGGCLDQKHCLIAYNGNAAIGFIDILKDFPQLGTANLGLLAIGEQFQGR